MIISKLLLFTFLITTIIFSFNGMDYAEAEKTIKYDPNVMEELDPAFIIIGERTLKVEEKIDSVNHRLNEAKAQGNDFRVEKLTELLLILEQRYKNLIIAGEALGYMHHTTSLDSTAKEKFYRNNIPNGVEKNIEFEISCNCQSVKANMGYEYPTGFGYDGSYYLNPISYQTLINGITKEFSRNIHATFDYIKPFAVFDTSRSAIITVEGTYGLGGYSSDEKQETRYIYSFWPHRIVIATETNVISGTNLEGTVTWK